MRPARAACLLALAGCKDYGLTKFNATPFAEITSHRAGDAALDVPEGATITFEGRISDPDDDAETLVARWRLNGAVVCGPDAAGPDGGTACTLSLAVGDEELILEATDPGGKSGVASLPLVVSPTEAPTVTLHAPRGASRYYADAPIAFDATVADAETPAADLRVAWESDAAGPIDLGVGPDDAGRVVGSALLPEGPHLVTVRVEDAYGKSAVDSSTITVGPANTAPACTLQSPLDGAIFTLGDAVLLAAGSDDADEPVDGLGYTLHSSLDGLLDAGAPAADGGIAFTTLSLSRGDHVLTLTVTDERAAACTDAVAVTVGLPPEITLDGPAGGLEQDAGAPFAFRARVADADDVPELLSVTWESDLDGVFDTAAPAPDGTVAVDWAPLSLGVHVVTARVRDTDGMEAETSVLVEVNGPPDAPVVAIDPAAPGSGDDLTLVFTTAAVDPDGDPLTYDIVWERDGVAAWSAAAPVPASETAKNERWSVRVRAFDGRVYGPEASASVTIGNGAPTVTSATISPSAVRTDGTLAVAASGTDPDGDAVSLAWEWTVNGVGTGESGPTLDGGVWFEKGDLVSARVTASDGTDTSAPFTAAGVTVGNTAPGAPGVTIRPATPRSSQDDIRCAVTAATDLDADTLVYTVTWTLGGAPWAGPTATTTHPGDTIPRASVGAGETWSCAVTAFDGTDTGPAASDSATTVRGFAGWSTTTVSLSIADDLPVGEDPGDKAGQTVAGVGDVDGDGLPDVLVGAPEGARLSARTGMAYLVPGADLAGSSGALDLSTAAMRFFGEAASDGAARSLDGAGDLDGDGLMDLTVGAPAADSDGNDAGTVYLLLAFGLSTGSDTYLVDAETRWTGEALSDAAGTGLAGVGDVDGDGLAEVFVGAPGNDDAAGAAGKAYLLLGGDRTDGLFSLADASLAWTGTAVGDNAGRSVAGAGDVDGDGLDDLLVGAWGNDLGGTDAGAAFLVLSSALPAHGASLLNASDRYLGEDPGDYAGFTVAIPGDVDGDARADLLIGAWGEDAGGSEAGRAYLVFSADRPSGGVLDLSRASRSFIGERSGDRASLSLAGAGDVDRDGLADLLVGAPLNDNAGSSTGSGYLLLSGTLGRGPGIDLGTADVIFTGVSLNDQAAASLDGGGDLDGNGLADLLFGAPLGDAGGTDAGAVYVLLTP